MVKEIKDMTIVELLEGFKSRTAATTRHICVYDEDTRFWEVLDSHKKEVERFRQEILARFAALEKKNASSEQTTTPQRGVLAVAQDFSYLKDRPS